MPKTFLEGVSKRKNVGEKREARSEKREDEVVQLSQRSLSDNVSVVDVATRERFACSGSHVRSNLHLTCDKGPCRQDTTVDFDILKHHEPDVAWIR
jgi:hypothetical protein